MAETISVNSLSRLIGTGGLPIKASLTLMCAMSWAGSLSFISNFSVGVKLSNSDQFLEGYDASRDVAGKQIFRRARRNISRQLASESTVVRIYLEKSARE